jgi:hypothetical protein
MDALVRHQELTLNKIKLKINAKYIIMLSLISFDWKKLKINIKIIKQVSVNIIKLKFNAIIIRMQSLIS